MQRSPGQLIQALHKQPSHDLKSNNRQPMDRGTYHRARGLFGCSALVIARSTIDPAAPKGQKERAQGRAKRRPGYIWPIPIWRQIRMEFRLASCRLDSVFNIPHKLSDCIDDLQHSIPPFRPLYVPPNRTGCVHAAGQLSQRFTGFIRYQRVDSGPFDLFALGELGQHCPWCDNDLARPVA